MSNPSCDLQRFSRLWAICASTIDRDPPDYHFSFSRGPQLTTLPVTVRTEPPGPIALYGAKIDMYEDAVHELTGELGGPGGMSWNAQDGEAGNDDYEPPGPRYDNAGYSTFELAHVDEPKPLIEGNPKTAYSVAHAADKAHQFGGYTKQQSITMLTRLCLGSDVSAGEAMKILNELWGVIVK